MGANYEFQCEDCSLHAEVSGGPDEGMYASWTTIWCPDCKSLSDATTSSEDAGAMEEYQKHSVTLPENIICPNCKVPGLRTFKQDSCPRCGRQKTVLNKGDYFKAMLVCEPCETKVRELDSDQRFFVYPNDEVSCPTILRSLRHLPLIEGSRPRSICSAT